jgi:kynurenine formamidase
MTDRPLPAYDALPKARGGAGSGWHLFGTDDSVGLMNLQTPERIAAAAKLVKRGAVFSLNAPLDQINPAFYGRGTPRHTVFQTGSGGADDVIDNVYPQASSQWDSLGHACYERDVFYNGRTFADVRAGANTIDHWARRGIAGRAVVLDIERAYAARGRSFVHGTPHPITIEDFEAARKLAKITYEPGDVLLMHTGFLAWYRTQSTDAKIAMAPRTSLQAIGIERSEAMARYLWDTHAAALAGDNPGIEVWPGDPTATGPFGFLHHVLIGQFGLALGELWELDALAADCARDGVYETFFTAAPLNMPGGIGSPANALALK